MAIQMKSFAQLINPLLLSIVTLTTFTKITQSYEYEIRYIDQPVDHFNYENHDEFKQKLLVNLKHWKEGSPIFFYTGNEGPIEGFADNTGFIFEIAEQFKAGIVFAEHRYYGTSLPFGAENSFKKEKLGYLSIEQAMADFAKVIKGYKTDRVIAFGGSYGGMLAAYMRYSYPHLIHGAVAASAPIYLISGQPQEKSQTLNFFQAVTKDYTNFSPECSAKISSGFSTLIELAQTEKYEEFNKITKQCNPASINSMDKAMHVLEWARNGFVMMAMMDYPYKAEFMADLPAWPVNEACKRVLNPELNSAESVIAATSVMYGENKDCHDAFVEYIHCADPTGCGNNLEATAWDYQACTQMVLPGPKGYDMFFPDAWNITTLTDYCKTTYDVTPNPDWLAMRYGKMTETSRIIWSNGGLDPWGPGGVHTSDESKEIYALGIPMGAHHLDMRGANVEDPVDVVAVRKREVEIIGKWLE